MKVSVNWLKYLNEKYHCAADPMPEGIDKLVEKIGAQLGAIEEIIDIGARYKGIVVVRVVKAEKHPNADKLSLCLVDDGGVDKKVKRIDDGLIQIVCGAPNVRAGMLAAWIPPGATVPASFDKEPFVIDARPIRNKTSHGMLASPKELALSDDHDGILELTDAKPGDDFAKTYGLDDYAIDIENKMFTHRPDLFGVLGVAREIAGIQGHAFKSPDWYKEDAGLKTDGRNDNLKLEVKNQIPKLVPRFCAQVIKDIKVGPSPVWLQVRLSSVGLRSINNIVDITNFYMMETAQPLHAFDYDKIKTGVLGARLSKKGEKLALLNGKEIMLQEGDMVITDGQKPVGLAGIMGGADTEVDQNTKNIILECANFDMNQVRKTAMRYGLFTDASTRFTKNQSRRQNRAVIAIASSDVLRVAGGRLAGPIIDSKHFDDKDVVIKTEAEFINSRLGLSLSAAEIKKLLDNVEFKVTAGGQKLSVTVPFWRTDIKIAEDIVEEVGRLYGYDKLPQILPNRSIDPAAKNDSLEFKTELREIMIKAGANEVLTHSFVHEKLLKFAGHDPKEAYRLSNALSPDLQYYRLSLIPSLLEKVHPNVKAGFGSFAIYEIGKGHIKGVLDGEKLPAEFDMLAGVVVNPAVKGAPYYQARAYADYIFQELNITNLTFMQLGKVEPKTKYSITNCYDLARTSVVWSDKHAVGVIGEPTQTLRKALKLPAGTSMFELEIPNLYDSSNLINYRPLNRFPDTSQDICLRLDSSIEYERADQFIWNQLQQQADKQGYNYQVWTLDIFQKANDKAHKQITWRIVLSHPERTLTTDEVNNLMDQVAASAKQEIKAERI